MTSHNELEKKLAEFNDSPAHIIALNSWLLRTVPKSSRNKFLKDYVKVLTTAYHPDTTQDPKEKQRRERFIQSASNAVAYLTSSDMAYDMAIEEVPSERNPVQLLRNQLEQEQQNRELLEERIRELSKDNSNLSISKTVLKEQNNGYLDKIVELERFECFVRLKKYQDKDFKSQEVYRLNEGLMIGGRRIAAKRTFTDPETHETITECDLIELVRSGNKDFEKERMRMNEEVKEKLLYEPSNMKLFFFKDGKMQRKKEEIELVGGMPYFAMNEYLLYKNILGEMAMKGKITDSDIARFYGRIMYFGVKGSEGHRKYERAIVPFTTPYVTNNTPILISRSREDRINYELIFAEQIKRTPEGIVLGECDAPMAERIRVKVKTAEDYDPMTSFYPVIKSKK